MKKSSALRVKLLVSCFILLCALSPTIQKMPATPASNSSYVMVTSGEVNKTLLFITRCGKHDAIYQYPLKAFDTKKNRVVDATVVPSNMTAKWPPFAYLTDAIITSAVLHDTNKHDVLFVATRDWRNVTVSLEDVFNFQCSFL